MAIIRLVSGTVMVPLGLWAGESVKDRLIPAGIGLFLLLSGLLALKALKEHDHA